MNKKDVASRSPFFLDSSEGLHVVKGFERAILCLPVWILSEESLFKINSEPFFFIIFIYSVQTQSEVSAFILFHGSLPGFTFTFRFSLLSELESLVLKISL